MIALKDNPTGIDYWIQRLQAALYSHFVATWGVAEDDYRAFGRVYRVYDNDGKEYIPHAYTGGKEYEPLLFEDKVTVQSFFDIGETITVSEDLQRTAKVHLYYFVNLDGIYPNQADRYDEQVLNDVSNFVDREFSFIVEAKHVGIKKVLSDYSGYQKDKAAITNMQPYYAFKLEMSIPHYYVCPVKQYTQPPIAQLPTTRRNATGLDYWIQQFQTYLFNYVLRRYDLTPVQYNCLGRVYRNAIHANGKREYLPQVYTYGGEYADVLFDDKYALQSFFDVGETMKSVDLMTYASVSLYCFVDLEALFPDNSERMDEEFMNDIAQFVMESSPGFTLQAIHVGAKKVLEPYSGYRVRLVKDRNVQPFYCFRLDMTKYYDPSVGYCSSLMPEREYQFNPDDFNPDDFA